MTNFTKVTVSSEALATGDALEMLALMTQLQQKQYDSQNAGITSEGMASHALGKAIQTSLIDDANSTEDNAYGQIANGATGIASEGVAAIYSFGHTMYVKKSADAQMQNVNEWRDGLTEVEKQKGANPESGNANAEEMKDNNAELKSRLRQGLRNLKNFGDQESKSLLEDLQTAKAKGMDSEIEKFREGLDKKDESIMNDASRSENNIDRRYQGMTGIGNSFGAILSAQYQKSAAEEKKHQADQELIRSRAQYVYDAMKQANQTAESMAQSTESNKRSLIDTLLKGLADSNRV